MNERELALASDKLRPLQAVRQAVCLGIPLDSVAETALKVLADQILQPPAPASEQVAQELRPILISSHRVRGIQLLDDLGLVKILLPELLEMKGLPQGPPAAPTGDLWNHVLRVLDLLGPEPSFSLALAALLHDIGKRRTVGRTPLRYTFYYHEHVGRRMASDICRRLCLPTAEAERVVWLVEKHQFLCDASHMRHAKLHDVLTQPGIHELLDLHRADAQACGRSTQHVAFCEQMLKENMAAPKQD